MRVKLFTFFYNEEFLIPFYLSHYWWADCIHALVTQGTDKTIETLVRHSKARDIQIQRVNFPDGFDDTTKINLLNEQLYCPDHRYDWHIVVDADEFVFPPGRPDCEGVPILLSKVKEETVLSANMCHVFRHESDQDLDLQKQPIVLQRRHGCRDSWYHKPIIFRPNHGIQLGVGQHRIVGGLVKNNRKFDWQGAHWANADPSFSIQRRVRDRSQRLSAMNRKCGYGHQHFDLTEERVREELEAHQNDLPMF